MVPEGSAFPVANAFDVVVREYLLATGFLPVENRKGGVGARQRRRDPVLTRNDAGRPAAGARPASRVSCPFRSERCPVNRRIAAASAE